MVANNFKSEIEEISKGEKDKDFMHKSEHKFVDKKSKNTHKHNLHKKKQKYLRFEDKDVKELKDSESIHIKPSPGSLGAMSELAREKLSVALNKKVESVVSISKQEGGWVAEIEVIDEEFLPDIDLKSMSDIIGLYDIQLDDKNELVSWKKKSSRKRGELK